MTILWYPLTKKVKRCWLELQIIDSWHCTLRVEISVRLGGYFVAICTNYHRTKR